MNVVALIIPNSKSMSKVNSIFYKQKNKKKLIKNKKKAISSLTLGVVRVWSCDQNMLCQRIAVITVIFNISDIALILVIVIILVISFILDIVVITLILVISVILFILYILVIFFLL